MRGARIKDAVSPAISLATIILIGCVGQTTRPDAEPVEQLSLELAFVDQDGNHVPREDFPEEVFIRMPVVPEAIFGTPVSRPIYAEAIARDEPFVVDLERNLSRIRRAAGPLHAMWRHQGLEIEPSETELARVGTFAMDPGTGDYLGAGAFMDADTGDTLILVYVDRPCRIDGLVESASDVHDHRLSFPSAGYHWVRVERLGTKSTRLVYEPAPGAVLFAVQVDSPITL